MLKNKKAKLSSDNFSCFPNGKKAELTTEEILKLILAAAGIFLLVFLMYKLISPNFDKDNETAKAYLDTFKKEIAKVDAGQTGEFNMWQNASVGASRFSLVYFGDKRSISIINGENKPEVWSLGFIPKNTVCICYYDYNSHTCKNCISLSSSARTDSGFNSGFFDQGTNVIINKSDGQYYFVKKIDNVEIVKLEDTASKAVDKQKSDAEQGKGVMFVLAADYLYFKFDSSWKYAVYDSQSTIPIGKIADNLWQGVSKSEVDKYYNSMRALSVTAGSNQIFSKTVATLDKDRDLITSLDEKTFDDGKVILTSKTKYGIIDSNGGIVFK
jgi:hypothetical protein